MRTLGVLGVEGEAGPSASLDTALSIPAPGVSGVAGVGGARPFEDLAVAGVDGGTDGTVGEVTVTADGTDFGGFFTVYLSSKLISDDQ